MNSIGENLVVLRKRKGLSQGDLANELFITPQAISRWERGETEPDIETIKKLCVVLDASLDDLICGVSSPLTRKQDNRLKVIYIVSSILMVFLIGFLTVMTFLVQRSTVIFIVTISIALVFLVFILSCEIWKLVKQRKLDEALKSEDAEK